jgi:unsaturated chondroitin disaccharide hydrolase
LQVIPAISLSGAQSSVSVPLPPSPWEASFDVRVARGARLRVSLGGGAKQLARFGGGRRAHVELTASRLSVGGRAGRRVGGAAGPLVFLVAGGHASVRALIISSGADRGALLLHRLAELHARVPAGRFPIGATRRDAIQYADRYWTNGFWAGALWQAAALATSSGRAMFARWALAATADHFGQEHSDSHDVGFMYGESSLAAWRSLCRGRPTGGPALCGRLKRSVLAAADELVALAASNRRAGTIPVSSTSGDTIVDSMMNVAAILPWASRVTGNPTYSRVALRHARVVASLLVRRDGSTAQVVTFDRAGRVLSISTHQGLSDSSTWSRGQAWAVYGFAQAAVELHDVGLLRVALRTAAYVAGHLSAGGIPRWDYDAPAADPVDVSAGVITAAGLAHLARACRAFPGECVRPGQWVALGRRMLRAALRRASMQPPLGLLGSEVLNEHGRGCWCNGGELIFGLAYALEAENLLR